MRALVLAVTLVLEVFGCQIASASNEIPLGILPDLARPLEYRVDLTIVPEQKRFGGRVEIDLALTSRTAVLYMHGRDLRVSSVYAREGDMTVKAVYSEVARLGVARLTFAESLPAGPVTLIFEYTAPFRTGPSGLYHTEVGGKWYAWSQFESINARAAFPSFDQPGYKTPFKISILTKPGNMAVTNAPEQSATRQGDLERHVFEPTKPLPTYLVAFVVGPFVSATADANSNAARAQKLPIRIIATQPNHDRLSYALGNSGKIVELLEGYFGTSYPFSKLDQIASPLMPGAMENAAAITYGDDFLLLDKGASTSQMQIFGMAVAHELAHQWFGDLVTPKWWDDIWLNESFANWMGYRIAAQWRPDLMIGEGAVADAIKAMNVDELRAGRPIHQTISRSDEIDSAFDSITYGKGGQVIAMIAAYLGEAQFQAGVRLYLNRYKYSNASTDDFFSALADSALDPRILDSLRSFINQQGVPVIRIERTDGGLLVTQSRYARLGKQFAGQMWTIPACIRISRNRRCFLLDEKSGKIAFGTKGAIVGNAGGTGYYRFSLPEKEWTAVIADAAHLPPREALTTIDSLWADFRAGNVPPQLLVDAAKTMVGNSYSDAVTDSGRRFADLRRRGIIDDAALQKYRSFISALYLPILRRLGFDPKEGAYAAERPDTRKLRADVVRLLVDEARVDSVRSTLSQATKAFLDGDTKALDRTFLSSGLAAYVASGHSAVSPLFDQAVASEDAFFRKSALVALGGSGDATTGRWLIEHFSTKGLRPEEQLNVAQAMILEPTTRDMGVDWLISHYDKYVKDNSIFSSSGLASAPSLYCSDKKAAQMENELRPRVKEFGPGKLALDRALEEIRDCDKLKRARGRDVMAALH